MNYTKTYSGRRLLEKYSLNESGVWEVRGEDPNCDMSGYHHEPYLGTYTGVLSDVIKLADSLPGFWGRGAGGSITKLDIMDATTDLNKINTKVDELIATLTPDEIKELKRKL